MISPDSTRVGKMVRYHKLQASKRKLSDKLKSQARFFASRVDEILTPGSDHWAEKLYSDRDELVREIMFHENPFRLARKAGRVMDNQNLLDLGKERHVQQHAEELRARGNNIQEIRREYLQIQGEVEKITTGRHASKYEAVSTVREFFRDKYYGEEVGPLLRINRLQGTIQPDQSCGTRVGASSQEKTPGQAALQNMAKSNSPIDDRSIRSIKEWEGADGSSDKALEAATWALYLHVAAGGFHPAGPAKPTIQGEEIPCRPAEVVGN